MSMITASVWVPRGAPAEFPTKYDVDEKELARISKLAKLQLDDAKEDLREIQKPDEEASQTTEDDDTDIDMEDGGVELPLK